MTGSDMVSSRKAAVMLSALLICGSPAAQAFVPHHSSNRAFSLRSTATEQITTTETSTEAPPAAEISAPPSESVIASVPAPAGNTEGQASKLPVSIPMDRPNAFVSGTAPMQTFAKTGVTDPNNLPVSLPMDRPNAFVSGTAPMPTFAKTGGGSPADLPASLPMDRQAAFAAGGLPHQMGSNVAYKTTSGPAPDTIPVDSWNKFHGGDVFSAGTPHNPTFSKTGGNDQDLPTSLPMDRPNAFVSGTAPMQTFAKTGTTDPSKVPTSLPMDRPNAFSAGGLPHQNKKF